MLRKAFNSVEMASQSGGLDSHQFSALWRSLSGGQQDLYREISMFHRFNTSGQGVVSFEVRRFSSVLRPIILLSNDGIRRLGYRGGFPVRAYASRDGPLGRIIHWVRSFIG